MGRGSVTEVKVTRVSQEDIRYSYNYTNLFSGLFRITNAPGATFVVVLIYVKDPSLAVGIRVTKFTVRGRIMIVKVIKSE